MSEVAVSLSALERSRLVDLERVVERGRAVFVEVGLALAEIRDSRLYRDSHGTFEDYCRERWGFSDRYGRYLMDAAAIGTIVPVRNEAQARELAPLLDQPEILRDTWALRARIVGLRADGATLQAIADVLNDEQVPTSQNGASWYPSTIKAVLEAERVTA